MSWRAWGAGGHRSIDNELGRDVAAAGSRHGLQNKWASGAISGSVHVNGKVASGSCRREGEPSHEAKHVPIMQGKKRKAVGPVGVWTC